MTLDCLLISVFLPVFPWCDHKIVLQMKTKQMQKLVKTGKYTEINKQFDVKFWLNWRKYGTVSYSFSCTVYLLKILAPSTVSINLELRWGIWANLVFKYPYIESNVKLGCCSIINWCSMIFMTYFYLVFCCSFPAKIRMSNAINSL